LELAKKSPDLVLTAPAHRSNKP